MWDAPVMRWLALPAIFLVVGPPAGALALFLLALVIGIVSSGAFADLGTILPLLLLLSYPFGGVQALVTGLVAAATRRRGGPVRAAPTLLASLVIGLTAAAVSAVAQEAAPAGEGGDGMASLLNAATLLVVHLAGALAGLGACRGIERAGARRVRRG